MEYFNIYYLELSIFFLTRLKTSNISIVIKKFSFIDNLQRSDNQNLNYRSIKYLINYNEILIFVTRVNH